MDEDVLDRADACDSAPQITRVVSDIVDPGATPNLIRDMWTAFNATMSSADHVVSSHGVRHNH